ncbi:hypothetical protein QO004_005588 [Rhizobium mesoamericanum]|uniref:conjugal transfer protein TraB n=1 Tax=Rhizobium mesoamericanum TaxID=1079800 RepID=UPI00277F8447|nr:conjugal transfer protein TraB [Rhizobium mesoamericanum]MDQ0563772.1 hypothetical protein [Rhizobium mesoamericanum]
MHRDWLSSGGIICAAAAAGWAGWSGNVLLLPLSAAFPALWSIATTRATAASVSAAYFLAASRGLPQGVAAFYASDILPGLLLWLTASSAFVAVHAALWSKRQGWLPLRYLAASGLMAVPPFGILGWAHPLTTAGVLFPGWRWLGLVAMAAGLAVLTTRFRPAAAFALAGFWLWSATSWTAPKISPAWHAVDLHLGASLGRTSDLVRHRDLVATARATARGPGDIVVLPESTLGFWTVTVQRFWQRELSGTGLIIVAGAAVVDDAGYDNVVVIISESKSSVVYRERMPVPGSMWQPWQDLIGGRGAARAHFFANPVVDLGGTLVAPLICYEQLIVWPVLQSMLHDPDLIVAIGNGWWTSGTSIVDIQRASAAAWARLFHKPLVMSFNT